ncbi:hypothetical protein GA829_13980 [Mesorhizobium sp. INR15]|nr:hypothetical protein GA829_13980 [Mesorhizobium sp. INR15]
MVFQQGSYGLLDDSDLIGGQLNRLCLGGNDAKCQKAYRQDAGVRPFHSQSNRLFPIVTSLSDNENSEVAGKQAGVIAWSRNANPSLGEYGEPTTLFVVAIYAPRAAILSAS